MAGQPVAFDVTRAEQIWRLSGVTMKPKLFSQVLAIADAALDEMNAVFAERRDKAPK